MICFNSDRIIGNVKNSFLPFIFLFLIQAVSYSQTCCCGQAVELVFPGFDFEIDPLPPSNSCNTYYAGPMGPWNVTVNCVDNCGPLQASQGLGNPNGASNYCDLNNTTNSPCGPGTIQYPLTGLIPGNSYKIEWYHSKSQAPTYCVANCKIAGGAWLNVTWEATTLGHILWLKASYDFTAQASSAILQFSDAGSISPWPSGVQIDDIKIYGCPDTDHEKPIVNNPPNDTIVSCDKDVPNAPKLDISDNCDPNPKVKFTEYVTPCKKVTREWSITDACGNITITSQIIDIMDLEKPVVHNPPQSIEVDCDKDVPQVPNLDVTDNCDSTPKVEFKETTEIINPCVKKITRKWNITDACGNTTGTFQIIDVIDKKPVINNPPDNIQIECTKDIPPVPILDISYKCDTKPIVAFNETTVLIDACITKISRIWTVTDKCGNSTSAIQLINIIDQNPPEFTKLPDSKLLNCDQDITKEFDTWIKKAGNADATDVCDTVTWSANYNHYPKNYCDTVLVEFIAKDHCGNVSSKFASFIVRDTITPAFTVKAENKNFVCVPNTRDSLRNWLSTNGFSQVSTNCDTVILSSNFDGDSTKNPLQLTFYAKDRCGNTDSCTASFTYRSSSDTLHVTTYSCNYPQNAIDTITYDINGCDSIVIHEKIKRLSDSIYIQLNTCDPLQKKRDTIHLTNSSGCDSLIFNEYALHPKAITYLQKMDCAFTKALRDTAYYLGQFCDSLVITEYIPLRKDSSWIIRNTCDISKVDTTIIALTNRFGCDSIVTVYTKYSPQILTFIENKTCGLKNSFIDTVTLATGLCDSVIITTHSPLPLDTSYIQSTNCDKSKTGVFSNKLRNRFGCDSLVIEEILLSPPDSIFISQSSCILSQSGIHFQNLKNRSGCDSIIQTITHFIPSDTTQIKQISCDFSATGVKTEILKGSQCDSVIITKTTFVPSDTTQITKSSCDLANVGLSKLVLQNTNGCDSLVLIQTDYVPLQLLFNLDSITCFNQNDGIFRILNSSDFGAPFDLFINNNKIEFQNQVNNLSAGTYEIYIRDKNGCVTDSVQFSLNNPPALIIDLGNDLEVKKGSTINLNLQSNRRLQNIFWQPNNLTNCNNCKQINFIIDEDTWVFAQAIDDRNCIQNDSIFIRVKKSTKVYAPNSFSPNGDNINDYFYIQGDDIAIVETMFIYDRWGEKVFETNNVPVNVPAAGWNGTFNAQKMNPGVFVYYVKVRKGDGEIVELRGDLSLIR